MTRRCFLALFVMLSITATVEILHVLCVVAVCFRVCVVAASEWCIFPLCNYRTPTPLSVLILTLSGRYSNGCSPLGFFCQLSMGYKYLVFVFPSVPIINSFLVGVQHHHVQ